MQVLSTWRGPASQLGASMKKIASPVTAEEIAALGTLGEMKMNIPLSARKKAWIHHQVRTAIFFQVENWEALYEMERLIGGDCCDYDVVGRYFQLAPDFSGKRSR
jgi:hypothetical protein